MQFIRNTLARSSIIVPGSACEVNVFSYNGKQSFFSIFRLQKASIFDLVESRRQRGGALGNGRSILVHDHSTGFVINGTFRCLFQHMENLSGWSAKAHTFGAANDRSVHQDGMSQHRVQDRVARYGRFQQAQFLSWRPGGAQCGSRGQTGCRKMSEQL